MIPKINAFILGLFILCSTVQAQLHDFDRCGTMKLDEYYRNSIPGYIAKRSLSEKIFSELTKDKSAGNITIPVVFHVIYRLDEQNISSGLIQSQLDVMNKDFNKLNWDTMLVPPVWKSLIADCEIEFKF